MNWQEIEDNIGAMKLEKGRRFSQPPKGSLPPSQAAKSLVSFLPSSLRQGWFFGLCVIVVTMIAYLPVWHAGFIWDDDQYVVRNTALHSLAGLRRIWFEPGATVQYYPLTFTTFWLEYHFWGLEPLGYHLVNVLLHSCNAILIWLILRRLRVPGAWLAAGLFVLHPVCVESVAWVTEHKNTLSGLFYLSSILTALKFWLPESASSVAGQKEAGNLVSQLGNRKYFWLALALYVCALLSKTAAVPMPVVVLLLVWWKRGRLGRNDVFAVVPFLAIGMAMGLVTMYVETHLGAAGKTYGFSLLERCLIASRDVWFYLGKLLWPHPLIFEYQRWNIQTLRLLDYLPPLAGAVVLCLLWLKRNGWGRPILCAWLYFLFLLFPVLGFVNVYYFRYSFVSDHFQYLASIGPMVLVSAGIAKALDFCRKGKLLPEAALGVLLLVMALLTWQQCTGYTNLETLWRTTLARNPDASLAHNNLGHLLLQRGQVDEALTHLQSAVAFEPDDPIAQDNLGSALLEQGRINEAVARFQKALELKPDYARAYNNLGKVLLQNDQTAQAIAHFQKALTLQPDLTEACYNLGNAFLQKGQRDSAVQYWQKALQIEPDYALARNNLGNVLLQDGKLDEAEDQFQQALKSKPELVDARNNLASALLQKGRLVEAVQQWQKTLEFRPAFGPAQNNLAWVLATCPEASLRNGSEAIDLAQHANQYFGGKDPIILRTLAAAYAEAGRFGEAVATAQQAMQLAVVQSDSALVDNIRVQLAAYQASVPFRDTNLINVSPLRYVNGSKRVTH